MERRVLLSLPVLALAGLLAGAVPALAASDFMAVPHPDVAGSNFDELDGVASVSTGDAWTVGFSRVGSGPFRALLEHWNGSAWSIAASASRPPGDDTRFHGVSAAAAGDVWAVGSDTNNTGHSLIEHWNGSSWSVVASPPGEPAGAELKSVAAISSKDVWAVGDANGGAGFEPLIEHFDGNGWHLVAGAKIPTTGHDFLSGVAGSGPKDVWAVGRTFRHSVPLLEHWDGVSWTTFAQPVSGFDSSLTSVSVLSSREAWAVGTSNLSDTVTEHWDGTSWSLVPSPSPSGSNQQNTLTGVTALNDKDVWAVGQTSTLGAPQTLAEHWDGIRWAVVPAPNPQTNDLLSGVAGSGVNSPLWAVGNSGSDQQSLIAKTTG